MRQLTRMFRAQFHTWTGRVDVGMESKEKVYIVQMKKIIHSFNQRLIKLFFLCEGSLQSSRTVQVL